MRDFLVCVGRKFDDKTQVNVRRHSVLFCAHFICSCMYSIYALQCCGTVMIYCSSGSLYGKVLVPAPFLVLTPVPTLFPVQAPVPVLDPDLFNTVFNNQKFVQNLALSVLEAAFFPRKLASKFRFVDFITFYVGPGSKSNCKRNHSKSAVFS